MDKNDILDYVTETPGNTNRAVLGSMLDSFAGGGGGNEPLVVNATLNEERVPTSLNRTWQEIYDAFPNTYVHISADIGGATLEWLAPFDYVAAHPAGYAVCTTIDGQAYAFTADSPSGYPIADSDGGSDGPTTS